METTTHIGTLRVHSSRESAQRVHLRLSTKMAGADLRPSGLAPSRILFVREFTDPAPGRVSVDHGGARLDRTWLQSARGALSESLHRAVRPSDGRVPSQAEAVLFQDPAEAWACWCRKRVVRGPAPWWMDSLETLLDGSSVIGGTGPDVATVWYEHPRLVPAMAAHLARWDAAVDVVRQISEEKTAEVLGVICRTFEVPVPPSSQRHTRTTPNREVSPEIGSSVSDEERDLEAGSPPESRPTASVEPRDGPPWISLVEDGASTRLVNVLARESPGYRQLLGVALALHERPVAVRSRSFQVGWRTWRHSVERSGTPGNRTREEGDTAPSHPVVNVDVVSDQVGADRSSRRDDPVAEGDEGSVGARGHRLDRQAGEEPSIPGDDDDGGAWNDAHTATDLGGILYLVNVLQSLDLPGAATVPLIGEHVGAWAILEALGRALLGPDEDILQPNDPLWRGLAVLDGRRPTVPAGRPLDEASADVENSFVPYRMPAHWLEVPHVDPPIEGRWTVENGRLRAWTDLGCVADLVATDDPSTQVSNEWTGFPNTGVLQQVESSDAMPLAREPSSCGSILAWWAARAAPYVRRRLTAAIGVPDLREGWVTELFGLSGRVYTTDTHLDLVLPLGAACTDVRLAGLDRSPGWWAAGGRVVRFHFWDTDV